MNTIRNKLQLAFSFSTPAIVWQTLFFYLPLLLLILSAFFNWSEKSPFSSDNFQKISLFLTPLYTKVIFSSLLLALSTALLCLAIGYPLAYFLAFKAKKAKNLLLFFLIVPFWINFLLHVYAWFFVLEKEGFINNFLQSIHLIQHPTSLLNSLFAIQLMMIYYYLPFMILPLYASLEQFDSNLIEASFDLGGTWWQTMRRVMLPLSKRGILTGFFLVYIPSFGEFAIPELMGGDRFVFVGNVISQYILGESGSSYGAAFTFVSIFVMLITLGPLYWTIQRVLTPRGWHG